MRNFFLLHFTAIKHDFHGKIQKLVSTWLQMIKFFVPSHSLQVNTVDLTNSSSFFFSSFSSAFSSKDHAYTVESQNEQTPITNMAGSIGSSDYHSIVSSDYQINHNLLQLMCGW